MNGERNLQLIREIEANRDFLLATYRQNPALLARVELRIRQLFQPLPDPADTAPDSAARSAGTT
jgi:hypothetical protein